MPLAEEALDGEDLPGELGQERRLEPGAGPDLEHPLLAGELQQLEVLGMHPGLRDGLCVADGERRILVRAMLHAGGHEEVARHLVEGLQHREVADPLRLQLLDEAPARPAELPDQRGRHQRSASSSRSLAVRSRCSGVTDT